MAYTVCLLCFTVSSSSSVLCKIFAHQFLSKISKLRMQSEYQQTRTFFFLQSHRLEHIFPKQHIGGKNFQLLFFLLSDKYFLSRNSSINVSHTVIANNSMPACLLQDTMTKCICYRSLYWHSILSASGV